LSKSSRKKAANNPRVLWPRHDEWSDVLGQYGHGMNVPVNRRNPKAKPNQGKAAMHLFHSGQADSLAEAWEMVKATHGKRRS